MNRKAAFILILFFVGFQFAFAQQYDSDSSPQDAIAEVVSSDAEEEDISSEAEEVAMEAEDVSFEAEEVAMEAEDVSSEAEEVAMEAEDVSSEAEEVAMEAEDVSSDAEEVAMETEDAVQDTPEEAVTEVSSTIRNNRYYLESIRLTKMAQNSYEEGDYDASQNYANEAMRYAQLSDDYVALQLKIKEANDAIAAAGKRLEWATSSGAAAQYPSEYDEAQTYYMTSLSSRRAGDWDAAIEAANNVINILAYLEAPQDSVLPAQYVVRTWIFENDCLWNIAARPWVYGDPFKWRVLYDANRAKMPQANNPDLIEPGMVLDIPSIKGEVRQGTWDSVKTYPPIN